MSKIDDLTRLKHIADAADKVVNFVASRSRDDLESDEMLTLASVRLIKIIGEAANHVSMDCQKRHPEIPWRQMIGMRNRLIHAYFDVDLNILWVVVSQNIPPLSQQIRLLISELET